MFAWSKICVDDLDLKRLTGSSISVYLSLVRLMEEDFIASCPYIYLCEYLEISERTAFRSVKQLEEFGLIWRLNVAGQVLTCKILKGSSVGKSSIPKPKISKLPVNKSVDNLLETG